MVLHPINLLIPLLVLLPNLLYAYLQPKGPGRAVPIKPIYSLLEKVGQIGMVVLPLFFAIRLTIPFMGVMLLLLVCYYLAWARYFHTRERKLLYTPFFFIPLPLAILPVTYFLLSTFLFNTPPIYIAWLFLAIGHIAITYKQGSLIIGSFIPTTRPK